MKTIPTIAVDGTKVFACWQDARWINSDDPDPADIYFTESSSRFADSADRTNILVNDDDVGRTQAGPDIGIDKDGNPYMVWVDNREGNDDIFYAGAFAINGLETTIVDDGSNVTVKASTVANLQVTIPVGALPARVDADNITIAEISNLPKMPSTYGSFGLPFKFGPSGLQFNLPVTIRISHAAADCLEYSVYRIYRYDPSSFTYWSEDGIHNPATHSPSGVTPHYLEVEVDHFSAFSPGGGFLPTGGAVGGGGGGGGGGGCSIYHNGRSNVIEYMLPYVFYVVVLLLIKLKDTRNRKAI